MSTEQQIAVYWYPGMCVRATLIALEEIVEETGTPFEARLVVRADADEQGAYEHDVNPKGKIPTLQADGRFITESPTILWFLNRRFPDANLLPKDPVAELEALELMCWFSSGLHPNIAKIRFPRSHLTAPDCFSNLRDVARETFRDYLRILEDRFSDGREWIMGDRWSAVDGYLLWVYFRALGCDIADDEFPLLDASARRCEQRPGSIRTLDREVETYTRLEAEGKTVPHAPPLTCGYMPPLGETSTASASPRRVDA